MSFMTQPELARESEIGQAYDHDLIVISSEGGSSDDEEPQRTPQKVFNEVLKLLHSGDLVFAVGGSVPVRSSNLVEMSKTSSQGFKLDPVTIRWDSDSGTSKLTLPLGLNESPDALLGACSRASFGLGNRDVIDESYRKALKLDCSQFSTNFCPYSAGIINTIQNTLLQATISEEDEGIAPRDMYYLEAKLYALNIYSGPSGRFKAHVDTPRGFEQYASLVVCLPLAHKGGELRVSNSDKDMLFDWSAAKDEIRWAAFFSSCEHEVLEVTEGHRLTLTYNLFIRRGSKSIARPLNPIENPLSKLLAELKELIQPGEVIGLYCNHRYYHTISDDRHRLSQVLKGVDALFYSSMADAGFHVKLRPVLLLREGQREDLQEQRDEDPDSDMDSDIDSDMDRGRGDTIGDFIGSEFPMLRQHSFVYGETCGIDGVIDAFDATEVRGIHWLNKPVHEEYAMTYVAYGNNAEIDGSYSAAAIIATCTKA